MSNHPEPAPQFGAADLRDPCFSFNFPLRLARLRVFLPKHATPEADGAYLVPLDAVEVVIGVPNPSAPRSLGPLASSGPAADANCNAIPTAATH
jgi:hypothetical protein